MHVSLIFKQTTICATLTYIYLLRRRKTTTFKESWLVCHLCPRCLCILLAYLLGFVLADLHHSISGNMIVSWMWIENKPCAACVCNMVHVRLVVSIALVAVERSRKRPVRRPSGVLHIVLAYIQSEWWTALTQACVVPVRRVYHRAVIGPMAPLKLRATLKPI